MNTDTDPREATARARRSHRALPLAAEPRRLAAVVLEVLAGVRTPAQAAEALGVSPMRYYQLEGRALAGLVGACQARGRGRRRGPEQELQALKRQNQRLERELARQRSLVRLAQRSLGLAPAPAAAAKAAGRKGRRPVVRALVAARKLQAPGRGEAAEAAPEPTPDSGPLPAPSAVPTLATAARDVPAQLVPT
jgi:hypothetical protein